MGFFFAVVVVVVSTHEHTHHQPSYQSTRSQQSCLSDAALTNTSSHRSHAFRQFASMKCAFFEHSPFLAQPMHTTHTHFVHVFAQYYINAQLFLYNLPHLLTSSTRGIFSSPSCLPRSDDDAPSVYPIYASFRSSADNATFGHAVTATDHAISTNPNSGILFSHTTTYLFCEA